MPRKKSSTPSAPRPKKRSSVRAAVPVRAIDFIMFNSRDVIRTRSFYQKLFGFSQGEEWHKGWSEFDTEPVTFCLNGASPDEEKWMSNAVIAFAVDDIQAAFAACVKRGVVVIREPYETRVCWMAFIEDPDHNQICLHQRKNGTAG